MSVVDNERPPYVVFEYRPVENRTKSQAAGHFVADDVAFAIITRPGSRDTLDKVASEWLKDLKERCRRNEYPQQWYNAFEASFNAWQKGEEIPTNGTAIKGWPLLGAAAQKELISVGIRTVEDLANLPDNELASIGLGALSYKQKAAAWLLAAGDTGKTAEKLTDLSTKVEALADLVRKQAEEINRLRQFEPKETAAAKAGF